MALVRKVLSVSPEQYEDEIMRGEVEAMMRRAFRDEHGKEPTRAEWVHVPADEIPDDLDSLVTLEHWEYRMGAR